MRFHRAFFNIILLGAALLAGCQTADDPKKELTAIRFHMEASRYGGDAKTEPVPIFREHPVLVNAQIAPFADERDIDSAEVIDDMGSFAIRIHFNRHGTWMLENVTRNDPQHRIAIFCVFDTQNRWLAAPRLSRPIADGILTFTPDATREEADRIVLGLNNAAAQIKKKTF